MGTAFTELRYEIKKSKIFGAYEASVRRGDLPSETRTALRSAVSLHEMDNVDFLDLFEKTAREHMLEVLDTMLRVDILVERG